MNGGRKEKGMRAMDNASRSRRPTTAHSWMVEWLLLFNVFFFSSLLFLSRCRSVNRMETLGEWMRNDNGKNYPSYFVHLQLTSRALNPHPATSLRASRHFWTHFDCVGTVFVVAVVAVFFSCCVRLWSISYVIFCSIVAPRSPACLILVSVYIHRLLLLQFFPFDRTYFIEFTCSGLLNL